MMNDPRMKGRPAGMPPPPMDEMFMSATMPQVSAAGMEASSPLGGIVEPNAAVPPPPAPVPQAPPVMPPMPGMAEMAGGMPAASAPAAAPSNLFPPSAGDQMGAIQRKLKRPGY